MKKKIIEGDSLNLVEHLNHLSTLTFSERSTWMGIFQGIYIWLRRWSRVSSFKVMNLISEANFFYKYTLKSYESPDGQVILSQVGPPVNCHKPKFNTITVSGNPCFGLFRDPPRVSALKIRYLGPTPSIDQWIRIIYKIDNLIFYIPLDFI